MFDKKATFFLYEKELPGRGVESLIGACPRALTMRLFLCDGVKKRID